MCNKILITLLGLIFAIMTDSLYPQQYNSEKSLCTAKKVFHCDLVILRLVTSPFVLLQCYQSW